MATDDPVVDPLPAALHGYIGATLIPPPRHEFGVSFYVTVWALLEKSIKDLHGRFAFRLNSATKLRF